MSQPSKSVLRKEILRKRDSISAAEWQAKSNCICDRLAALSLFQQAQTIFAYFSFRQEVDLASLFTLDKRWVFPRCVDKSLLWHLWQPGEVLRANKYGILEPLETAKIITSSDSDLILVPSVACDRQGYRLGYGGGFYDRLLSSPECSTVPTVGIVLDYAYIDQLPVDLWDIKLKFICTEMRFESP
jgi:5-formyltetrahydrofolate cyclo-ligase